MPKETVHWGKQYRLVRHPETELTGEYYSEEDYDPKHGVLSSDEQIGTTPKLEVHWSRPGEWAPLDPREDQEGFVQISLSVGRVELEQFIRNWEREKNEESDDSYHITSHGFFTRGLSRTQINNMIKVLKKARDQAFGADE